MKTINLYFDFEFTSLSPDAQPISVGIIADARELLDSTTLTRPYRPGIPIKGIDNSRTFYAEFSDFDINRCDDWVKEHVVGKLDHKDNKPFSECDHIGSINQISAALREWIRFNFSEYKIQFVCDCGTWDWYWMVQLLAEWDKTPSILTIEESALSKYSEEELIKIWRETPSVLLSEFPSSKQSPKSSFRTGLPKLPENISPVPFDLNDLIAIKKGITPAEAFDIERLGSFCQNNPELYNQIPQTHNALFDAKVIKESYHSLK